MQGETEGEGGIRAIDSRDALERAQRERRGEMRDKRRRERKEERRKGDVKAKGAKVGFSVFVSQRWWLVQTSPIWLLEI